ncbi:hypothetical protein LV28_25285 [Pandoraea pnomenusa]|nr:hypothetical protein LV28_25285 [Pandoraea pnomenusa]
MGALPEKPVSESSCDDLFKFVLRPVVASGFKRTNHFPHVSEVRLQRLNFISSRSVLFLELERGVLHVNDSLIQRLLRLGQFVVIARGYRCFRQIEGGFQTT